MYYATVRYRNVPINNIYIIIYFNYSSKIFFLKNNVDLTSEKEKEAAQAPIKSGTEWPL